MHIEMLFCLSTVILLYCTQKNVSNAAPIPQKRNLTLVVELKLFTDCSDLTSSYGSIQWSLCSKIYQCTGAHKHSSRISVIHNSAQLQLPEQNWAVNQYSTHTHISLCDNASPGSQESSELNQTTFCTRIISLFPSLFYVCRVNFTPVQGASTSSL